METTSWKFVMPICCFSTMDLSAHTQLGNYLGVTAGAIDFNPQSDKGSICQTKLTSSVSQALCSRTLFCSLCYWRMERGDGSSTRRMHFGHFANKEDGIPSQSPPSKSHPSIMSSCLPSQGRHQHWGSYSKK